MNTAHAYRLTKYQDSGPPSALGVLDVRSSMISVHRCGLFGRLW